jgi:2-octaprenylphenol hydroxylase
MKNRTMNQFDVIIIGGGIVGMAAACALGASGMTVAVVEARAPVADTGVRDARVFAITRASERIFRALGAWDAISARDICAFREMRVWDAGGSGAIHFDCADIGEPYLGHIIEPRFIQAALLERLQALAGVQLYCPAQFRDIEIDGDQVTVALDDSATLTARLVVAADGARSPLRERLGIQVREHDYRQSGLVALVKTEHGHRETAWQRFLPGGPLAFLPMSGGWSSIVWTLPSEEVTRLLALDKEAFHAALGEAFDFRLGRIIESEQRKTFPLRRLHAAQYIRIRAALIGDAAHTIHPLAGQGVNLGLLDAAALAEVLADAQARGKDVGSVPVLRRYERWRRGENQLMMSAMDGFNLLFSNARPPLRWARNLGLSMMDAAGPAKDVLMRHAMGLEGDLPALARSPDAVSGTT